MKNRHLFVFGMALALPLSGCGALGNLINNQGTESFPISEQQSKAKLAQLGEEKGYEISCELIDSTENKTDHMVFGTKGDTFWYQIEEGDETTGAAVKKVNDEEYALYSYSKEGYEYAALISDSTLDSVNARFEATYSSVLYFGFDYDGQLKKGTDSTVAGRSCYTYECKPMVGLEIIGAIAGQDMSSTLTLFVDKEYGFIMKYELYIKADGEEGNVTYQVTSFKTDSQVTVPELPEPVSILDETGLSFNDMKLDFITKFTTIVVREDGGAGAMGEVIDDTLESYNTWGGKLVNYINGLAKSPISWEAVTDKEEGSKTLNFSIGEIDIEMNIAYFFGGTITITIEAAAQD